MRVQTEEWRRFIPGVRMYRGKRTLFYNGEKLWEGEEGQLGGNPLIYDWKERDSWEVIIVLPGVESIPELTFYDCRNIKTVIMADTVRRVEWRTFSDCSKLAFVKLSRNLEYIGDRAFNLCWSLPSIFIPPSCREIGDYAFYGCDKLIIFQVPQHTQLGSFVIGRTALIRRSPFETDGAGYYRNVEEVNDWIRNLHADNEFSLQRACCSYNPLDEVIFNIIKRQGLKAFKKPDRVGVTASQYLSENTFADIEEQKIINRYILDMMGGAI